MLDFLQNLRLQTLYNPSFWNSMSNNGNPQSSVSIPNQTEPTFPQPMGPQNVDPTGGQPINQPNPQMSGIDEWLKQLYTPEHAQSDRLNTMLDIYPKREDPQFQHKGIGGFLTKLGAIAGGMNGGPGLYNQVMDSKYDDATKDWQNQIGPVERAATLEKQGNSNERQMAMQTIANKLREEATTNSNKIKEETLQNKEKIDAANIKIRQDRADVYEFKAHNPGMKLVITKGGNVQAMDPITGEMHDTGIPTGSLTDADKAALGETNKLEQIHATGEENRDTIGVKHENTLEEIAARGGEARNTKGTPSGNTTGNKPELPSQTRIRQSSKAKELYNTRPDLRPFIKVNGNDVQITPPGKNFYGSPNGPTPAQYKEINDSIYSGTLAPVSSHPNNTGTTPNNQKVAPSSMTTPSAPKAPAGWKYVAKPEGGWTAVPDPTNKGGD